MKSNEEDDLATGWHEDSLAGARILYLTDSQLHCLGLRKLLPSSVSLDSAETAKGGLLEIERNPPDVILLDLTMKDGVCAAQRIAASFPRDRILALSMSAQEAEVLALARAGISAYLPRGASLEDFYGALAKTIRGEGVLPHDLLRHLIEGLAKEVHPGTNDGVYLFSERERQVASLVMDRLSNHEISERLCIGEGTVKTHVHNLLEKTGTSSRRELASWLLQRRISLYSDTGGQKI